MKHKINQFLKERSIDKENFSNDDLYKVGMENVKENIEFYFDKTYSCESVIKELFIRGIVNYIDKNKFPCLEK
jgi:hypothetical protein